MTYPTQFRWTSASRSHVGLVRKINEDACLEQPERGIWVVADGMGGHTLGDVASRMVIDTLRSIPSPDSLVQFTSDVRDALQAVNRQLRVEAVRRDARIIGSTVVVLLAHGGDCTYLWAGDSRLYLYRNGRLVQLTRDHSQLEELRSKGNIGPGDVVNHPARNVITRAVGAADTLDLEEESMALGNGDMFLLCSDGLSNGVNEQEMHAALAHGDCDKATEALLDMALRRGGRDNISVVVVHAEDVHSSDKTVLNPAL